MLETRCSGFKRIQCKKYKAKWVGGTYKFLRQLMVSLKSYCMYPFVRKDAEATRRFFEEIYSAKKVDDLIFDGNDHSYLEKISAFIDVKNVYGYIYDCGCGNASFLHYLNENKIEFEKYVGIDFAIHDSDAKNKVMFVKEDIETFAFDDRAEERLVFLCNVSCYLSDSKIASLLKKVAQKGTTVIVVDPIPGLFWDATFDRVKLFYRSPKKIRKLMFKHGFSLKQFSKDYLWKIGLCHLFPLSYAGAFCYTEEVDVNETVK